jgi:hypothetical protein
MLPLSFLVKLQVLTEERRTSRCELSCATAASLPHEVDKAPEDHEGSKDEHREV